MPVLMLFYSESLLLCRWCQGYFLIPVLSGSMYLVLCWGIWSMWSWLVNYWMWDIAVALYQCVRVNLWFKGVFYKFGFPWLCYIDAKNCSILLAGFSFDKCDCLSRFGLYRFMCLNGWPYGVVLLGGTLLEEVCLFVGALRLPMLMLHPV